MVVFTCVSSMVFTFVSICVYLLHGNILYFGMCIVTFYALQVLCMVCHMKNPENRQKSLQQRDVSFCFSLFSILCPLFDCVQSSHNTNTHRYETSLVPSVCNAIRSIAICAHLQCIATKNLSSSSPLYTVLFLFFLFLHCSHGDVLFFFFISFSFCIACVAYEFVCCLGISINFIVYTLGSIV